MTALQFSEKVLIEDYWGFEFLAEGKWTPGYGPRPCSDPNNPSFSDPGEPDDVELEKIYFLYGKHKIELPFMVEELCEDEHFIEILLQEIKEGLQQ